MTLDNLTLATDVQLETLPPGLYVACDKDGAPIEKEIENVYQFIPDGFVSGPHVLLARVRVGFIPQGVEKVTIRGDGSQIIYQWVPTSEFGS